MSRSRGGGTWGGQFFIIPFLVSSAYQARGSAVSLSFDLVCSTGEASRLLVTLTSVLGLPFHSEPSDVASPELASPTERGGGASPTPARLRSCTARPAALPVRKASAGLWNLFLSVPETGQERLPASRLFVRVGLAAAGQAERVARRLQGTSPSWGQTAEG